MANRAFPKEQILSSEKYTKLEKDILASILQDQNYSIKEVDKVLKDFYNREVK